MRRFSDARAQHTLTGGTGGSQAAVDVFGFCIKAPLGAQLSFHVGRSKDVGRGGPPSHYGRSLVVPVQDVP